MLLVQVTEFSLNIEIVICFIYCQCRDETDHQTRGNYERICELERALAAMKDDRQREHAEWSQKVCITKLETQTLFFFLSHGMA